MQPLLIYQSHCCLFWDPHQGLSQHLLPEPFNWNCQEWRDLLHTKLMIYHWTTNFSEVYLTLSLQFKWINIVSCFPLVYKVDNTIKPQLFSVSFDYRFQFQSCPPNHWKFACSDLYCGFFFTTEQQKLNLSFYIRILCLCKAIEQRGFVGMLEINQLSYCHFNWCWGKNKYQDLLLLVTAGGDGCIWACVFRWVVKILPIEHAS